MQEKIEYHEDYDLEDEYIKIKTTIVKRNDNYVDEVRNLYIDYKNCESKYCKKCPIAICPRK